MPSIHKLAVIFVLFWFAGIVWCFLYLASGPTPKRLGLDAPPTESTAFNVCSTNEPKFENLVIIIPFRDLKEDLLSQGAGREQNLRDWLYYMNAFLKLGPVHICVIEQSKKGAFNKGFLFNVGYNICGKNSKYMVFHDVDQVPEIAENDYSFMEDPVHMIGATSQWDYKPTGYGTCGGALMITPQKYKKINGYSNKFAGWGLEDENMCIRLGKHFGKTKKLSAKIGRYRALSHSRVKGLDENSQFRENAKNKNDVTSGLTDLSYKVLHGAEYEEGNLSVHRCIVEET